MPGGGGACTAGSGSPVLVSLVHCKCAGVCKSLLKEYARVCKDLLKGFASVY